MQPRKQYVLQDEVVAELIPVVYKKMSHRTYPVEVTTQPQAMVLNYPAEQMQLNSCLAQPVYAPAPCAESCNPCDAAANFAALPLEAPYWNSYAAAYPYPGMYPYAGYDGVYANAIY